MSLKIEKIDHNGKSHESHFGLGEYQVNLFGLFAVLIEVSDLSAIIYINSLNQLNLVSKDNFFAILFLSKYGLGGTQNCKHGLEIDILDKEISVKVKDYDKYLSLIFSLVELNS